MEKLETKVFYWYPLLSGIFFFFQPKIVDIFLICPWKHNIMFRVHSRSVLAWSFWSVHTTFLSRNKKNTLFTLPPIWCFLARLNNVHGELLYYPPPPPPPPTQHRRRWRRHPQMLKFSLKFLKPHYFLTLSSICFIFGMMIHIGPKFCAVPSPPL